MTVGKGRKSLTKQPPLDRLARALAEVRPGSTERDVEALLESGTDRVDKAYDTLVGFEADVVVDDELLRACRGGDEDHAALMVWVAILFGDQRLAKVVEDVLTDADGRLQPARLTQPTVRRALEPDVEPDGLDKSASNVLGYMARVLFEPTRSGATITGMVAAKPTAAAVPSVVVYTRERLARSETAIRPPAGTDPVDLPLALGINHWLNLTRDEFRTAATGGSAIAVATGRRDDLPASLTELREELVRRGQVVLQGPPGVGKTHVAMRYVDWATGGHRQRAHVTHLLDSLPGNDRTTAALADAVLALGAPAVWEVVQFHPSYGYEDFVRTLVAHPVEGGVTFRPEHRVLSRIAALGVELAARGADTEVVLVLDEINRADVSRVFGELLYALEYRDEPVTTPYEVDGSTALTLPSRLQVIGTMNTADRSIALIDYALRRRFTFLDVPTDRAVVEASGWAGIRDRQAALRLYDEVAALFAGDHDASQSRDLAVGHSYFLPERPSPATWHEGVRSLSRRFAYEVGPLLREYASEGLLEPDRLRSLLTRLGVPDGATQAQTARAAERWLVEATAVVPVPAMAPEPTTAPDAPETQRDQSATPEAVEADSAPVPGGMPPEAGGPAGDSSTPPE